MTDREAKAARIAKHDEDRKKCGAADPVVVPVESGSVAEAEKTVAAILADNPGLLGSREPVETL